MLLDKSLVTDDIGYIRVFIDGEGNRVGVHSRRQLHSSVSTRSLEEPLNSGDLSNKSRKKFQPVL